MSCPKIGLPTVLLFSASVTKDLQMMSSLQILPKQFLNYPKNL